MDAKDTSLPGQSLAEFDNGQALAVQPVVSAQQTPSSEPQPKGDWKMTVEEFSFAGCHYNSSCD